MIRDEFSPSNDIKIDKPGGEGGTSGIEAAEFDPIDIDGDGGGTTVKIDQPGSEGGTAG